MFGYDHPVVGHDALALYFRFNAVSVLHQASVQLIVIVSLDVGHAATLSKKLGVGFVVSFKIVYVFHVIGHHHVSVTLTCTFVVHAAGVNVVHVLVHILIHDHHVLNSTVIGDGHRVHVVEHVVLLA